MSTPLSPSILTEAAKSRAEPGWLTEARVEALASYQKLDPPRRRRTSLASVDVEALARRAAAQPLRRAHAKAEGVVHLPLVEAAREHEDLVRPILTAPIPGDDKWARLWAALWSAGSLLHVEKGKEVAEPLAVETVHPEAGILLRDVVVLGPRAKASLVARSRGGAAGALSMEGLDLHLQEGADLSLATMQDLDHRLTLLANRRVRVERDARLAWTDGQFGAGTSVTGNENVLAGPGSHLRFVGAFFGSAGQHMDVTTSAYHEGPHTESQLDMKGALSDDGYAVNYSIVNIGPRASNSSGHQHQETLVLSDKARADAIPKLDVENNEVSASHGATVGQVDEDQLFYLRSRGFTELGAKRMIVEGFFEPLLAKIPVEDVREEIRAAIVSRLKG